MSLMVSISGIRGIVGESLTPEVIVKYVSAYAKYCNHGKIIIGRDGRITGKIVANIVSSTLLSAGCDVVALGIVPTPTVQIAVEQLKAAGGISITASHNPIEWNGMKFMSPTGMFLNTDENNKFLEIAKSNSPEYSRWDRIGKHIADESYIRRHIDQVLHLPYIDIEMIRRKKFTVVVDCINSAGGMIVPQLLRTMGCNVIEMNCDVAGIFARTPEPIPENLSELCAAVVQHKADLGIAVDPDVDRLVLITEKGDPLGEENTITTAVKFVLSHSKHLSADKQQVVVNLSTTRAVEDVARFFGAKVVRTPVGEINVARKMKEIGAVIGGEGSGGVILPAIHYGRDAIVGIGLILQQLAEFKGSLSEFKETLPQYFILKDKVKVGGKDPNKVLEILCDKIEKGGRVNTDDGLKVDYPDSWVHLRKSNTEPIIRIITEAPTLQKARDLISQFRTKITEIG
ncbi:MAG: phosphoglucosamine mutase [Bacteroidota bacterium]